MNEIKENNYYVVLAFMVKDLHLKGIERDVYAIIYGFCQNKGKYTGSLQYLVDWTCSSKQGVINALNKLIEKGLIVKNEVYFNNVKFVEYSITDFTTSQETLPLGKKSLPLSKETLPNNVSKDTNNNNSDNKYIHLGTYNRVKLTEEEYKRLCNEFGQEYVDQVINRLDEYVESTNNKQHYRNYNLVIRKAIRENWYKDIYKPRKIDEDNGGFTEL